MADHVALSRRPGRPRKDTATAGLTLISREMIVRCAYDLCDTLRVDDVSMVKLAKQLNISTPTIRHHVKSRAALVAAMIDLFYDEMNAMLPTERGDWQAELQSFIRAFMTINLKKRGFASFFFERRFEPALSPFRSESAGRINKRLLEMLVAAGLTGVNAALAWHLILHFVLSIAYADAQGRTPAGHDTALPAGSGPDNEDERAILAALPRVDVPMLQDVISKMLERTIASGFIVPARVADPGPKA